MQGVFNLWVAFLAFAIPVLLFIWACVTFAKIRDNTAGTEEELSKIRRSLDSIERLMRNGESAAILECLERILRQQSASSDALMDHIEGNE